MPEPTTKSSDSSCLMGDGVGVLLLLFGGSLVILRYSQGWEAVRAIFTHWVISWCFSNVSMESRRGWLAGCLVPGWWSSGPSQVNRLVDSETLPAKDASYINLLHITAIFLFTKPSNFLYYILFCLLVISSCLPN